MESAKKCGCKGIRTCLFCEKKERPLKQDDSDKDTEQYEFCPACNLCWPRVQGSTPLYLGKLIFLPEFVNETEENELASAIDSMEWMPSQSGRRKQDFGPKVNFKKKKSKVGDFRGFPDFTKNLIKRLQLCKDLYDFRPVELCHLDYDPVRGSAIEPHLDDTWIWGERLVTLNLLSSTWLTFTPACTERYCGCRTESLGLSAGFQSKYKPDLNSSGKQASVSWLNKEDCIPDVADEKELKESPDCQAMSLAENTKISNGNTSHYQTSKTDLSNDYFESKEPIPSKYKDISTTNNGQEKELNAWYKPDLPDSGKQASALGQRRLQVDTDFRVFFSKGDCTPESAGRNKLKESPDCQTMSIEVHAENNKILDGETSPYQTSKTDLSNDCFESNKHISSKNTDISNTHNGQKQESDRFNCYTNVGSNNTFHTKDPSLNEGITTSEICSSKTPFICGNNLCSNANHVAYLQKQCFTKEEFVAVEDACAKHRIGHKSKRIEVLVSLPARSLLVVAGCSRRNWFHEIKREDVGSRRLAMTFRELAEDFTTGGSQEAAGNRLLELGQTFYKMNI